MILTCLPVLVTIYSARLFVRSVTEASTAFAMSRIASAADAESTPEPNSTDDLNIALIGAGAEGRVLINACLRIPGIRFKAVCDIWGYSQRYAQRYLKKYKLP